MEFYEVVSARRTVRDFQDAPIDDETVGRILSAGLKAPTNDHLRDWHFIVIRDKNVVLRLIERIPETFSPDEVNAILRDWHLNAACQRNMYRDAIPKQYRMLAEASCVVIPLLRQKTDILHPESLSHLNGLASIWCCIENLFLAATAEGYACALRIPLGDEAEWSRGVLGYPKEYLMPCFIAIGKPKPDAARVPQVEIPLAERVHLNRW